MTGSGQPAARGDEAIPPTRIAVSGYYGCGNTGDEAVLAGIVESFRRRAGDGAAEFTVLSQDPRDTAARHGLRAVNRMSASVVKRTLRESDLLVSGGGSLLQDTTSLRSLGYYLWVVRTAVVLRLPVILYAQGIGPLRSAAARLMTRMVANRVQRITVRDPESAELLRRIGVSRPPLEVTADPAFALTAAPKERAREILRAAGAPENQPLAGFALRPWGTDAPSPEAYAQTADLAAARTGAFPVFLPMQPPCDRDLAERIASHMRQEAAVVRESLSPAEAVAVAAELSCLLGMRLHALIFGAAGGVPMVALSYDPKVASLMRVLGQESRSLALAGFRPESAASALTEAAAEGDAPRAAMRARAAELGEQALRNVDCAMALAAHEVP